MNELIYKKKFSYEIIENGTSRKCIYFFSAEQVKINSPKDMRVVLIYPYDWNLYMTPWKYTGQGMKETGEGKSFAKEIEALVGETLEEGENAYIGGYSLGGLMALFMAYNYDIFDGIASVSGSFWYPDAKEYFLNNTISEVVKSAYVSIGDKEVITKNEERASVLLNTQLISSHLADEVTVFFEINNGGHFTDVEKRIEKALNYLNSIDN